MSNIVPDQYFNRFDPSKEFDEHLFLAGKVLQSAELNEVQSSLKYRIRGLGDAVFKDGDIIRDAGIIVNASTGVTTCQSGAVYLQGAVRGAPTGSLTIPISGRVAVGLYIQTSYVTEIDDASLRDPAQLTPNYGQAGAGRTKLHIVWGYAGDSQSGDFFPVHTVQDGTLIAKDPPPNLDSVTQAIAAYDRDSAASSYVVSGLQVSQMADLVSGEQVYSVAAGRARVNGYGVSLATSRRMVYAATPDLLTVTSEPHVSTGPSSQLVNFNSPPAQSITSIQITASKTVTVTHGNFTGVSDLLPDNTVLALTTVVQGGTTYTAGSDYTLTGNSVNWSPAGLEPATGSTYSVTYTYIATVSPDSWTATGFYVTGAVTGTLVQVTYQSMLPRYDRLALGADGQLVWIKGVAAAYNPLPPAVPAGMLSIATIKQTWTTARTTTNDSVRVVPMSDLASINSRIDYLLGLQAQTTLQASAALIESSQKQGLFVDPFLDDSLRDAGVSQTAAVFNGHLTLPVAISVVAQMSTDVATRTSLPYSLVSLVEQLAVTGNVKVNPYQSFPPVPASVKLVPAVDTWTVINTTWASAITKRVQSYSDYFNQTTVQTNVLSSVAAPAEFLRPITIAFTLNGFGAGETLTGVTFDGQTVTAV